MCQKLGRGCGALERMDCHRKFQQRKPHCDHPLALTALLQHRHALHVSKNFSGLGEANALQSSVTTTQGPRGERLHMAGRW